MHLIIQIIRSPLELPKIFFFVAMFADDSCSIKSLNCSATPKGSCKDAPPPVVLIPDTRETSPTLQTVLFADAFVGLVRRVRVHYYFCNRQNQFLFMRNLELLFLLCKMALLNPAGSGQFCVPVTFSWSRATMGVTITPLCISHVGS